MRIARLIKIASVIFLAAISGTEALAKKNDRAKYVFLFIGDGMSFPHVSATESYLSAKEGKNGGEQLLFTEFPVHGSATTHSANRKVTDSSAAGTAIATGTKTNNGMLGVDPEGNKLTSVSYELQEDGYNVAVISSVPVNHATPASFYANSRSRSDYYNIMQQMPESGFEFFAGAGMLGYFGKDGKKESSADWLEKNGINVCYTIEETEEAIKSNDRIMVCQPYNKEREAANYEAGGIMPEGHILLADMLRLGMERLGDKQPFFIMCEGGEIDWAAHANKTIPTINSIIAFDEAIAVAYDFYLKHPKETLIIVTADHGTGGICFSEDPDWEKLDSAWVAAGRSNNLDSSDNRKLNKECRIGWATGGHTGDAVPVYAVGKGAEKFMGRIDNTEFKAKILAE